MYHRPFLLGLACFLFLATRPLAAPTEATNTAEEILKAAGLATDEASLLAFFLGRTLEDGDRDRIAALIRDLGADDFAVRETASGELVKIGGKAASLLRQAKSNADVEVARRAESCLRQIEPKQEPAVAVAVARLLRLRQPAAAAQTLLRFAPFADDRDTLDAVRDALAGLALRDGKPDPALIEALTGKLPLARGLAGEALVRAGQVDATVRGLLDNTDLFVRMRVGLAFVEANDKAVLPRLIDLLADLPRDQAQPVEDLLARIALEQSPVVPTGDDPAARRKCRDAWMEWWAKHGDGVDLAKIPRQLLVVMETSLGTIKVELFPDKAPVTVKNFLRYVEDKHYNGLIFHRVIPTFMIQGGGMEPGLKERKAREPIKNESANGLSNKRGTVAMARTQVADSATSQFFINLKDNDNLDSARMPKGVGYCVFAKVVEGMDIVDKIKGVATGARGGHQDVPLEDIVIKSMRVVR